MRSLDRIFRRNKPNLKTLAQWVKSLFSTGVNGAWYDPSDITRYMSPLGPELVTNGDFTNGTTGWSTGAGWTISGGIAVGTGATGNLLQSNVAPNPVGKTYQVKLTISGRTSGSIVPQIGGSPITLSADGVYTFFLRPSLNDATLYIPGSNFTGSIDNISVRELTDISTATLFQDAAGTTPVTAVGQPVGLMLDKSKGLVLGSELVTNGDFSNGTTGWSSVDAGNSISYLEGELVNTVVVSPSGAQQIITTVAGKTYILSGNIRVTTSTDARIRAVNATFNGTVLAESNVVTSSVATNVSLIFTATSNQTSIYLRSVGIGKSYFSNITVKELPGNHAFNPSGNSANFPVLSARYNLLTKTEDFSDASAWPAAPAWTYETGQVAPDGTATATKIIGSSTPSVTSRAFVSTGNAYKYLIWLKAGTFSPSALLRNDTTGVNLISASTTSGGNSFGTWTVSDAGGGWRKIEIVCTSGFTTGNSLSIYYGATAVVGAGNYYYVWQPDLRVANDALNQPAYQRVNTATDYDTVGFKPYLSFNGVNQWLQTNGIDFTYGDKMFVSAGVRKLVNTTGSVLLDLSTTFANNQTFGVFAPNSSSPNYAFGSKGTTSALAISPAAYSAPITNVLSGIGDISGDQSILRINGTQAAISAADQGTGNYGNYPLYLGARGGSNLWFNGRLYGLVVAGKQASAVEITSCERYLNQKTGAY